MKILAVALVALSVTVSPAPRGLEAGDTWSPTITLKRGGKPVAGRVSVRVGGRTFAARALGRGRYRASIVFDRAGSWTYAVRLGSRTVRTGTAVVAPPSIRLAGDVAVDADGSLLVADASGRVLRARDGTLEIVARLPFPVEVAPDPRGGVGVVHAERFVRTVGGSRVVELSQPTSHAYAPDGTLYVAELGGRVVRVRDDGSIETLVDSSLDRPHGLAVVGDTLYVGDTFHNALAAIDLSTRALRVVSRDLNTPVDLAPAPDGTVVVADYGNGRIARVTPTGVTTTVAPLLGVNSVWVAADGAIYATEREGHRVRRVDPATGEVTTVVGR